VLDRQDDLLGPEGLLSCQRGTDAVAAATLGTGVAVEELLPGELADVMDAVVLTLLQIGNWVKRTHWAQIAEEDVEGRGEQVQVLGVGDVDEEEQHHEHVGPLEDGGQRRRGLNGDTAPGFAEDCTEEGPVSAPTGDVGEDLEE